MKGHALYVPDENGNLVWLQLPSDPATPPTIQDALPTLATDFQAAVESGVISWWNGAGGPWVIDGLTTSLGGQWHLNVGDTDGDGLPDDLDTYPSDATNNSFYWQGGTYTVAGIRHTFRADNYAGTGADGDNNGIPDILEDWFTNPSAHGTLQHWNGGTFLIDSEYSTFESFDYYAENTTDTDGDGIPDAFDPYPSDVWNNTYFVWNGTRYAGIYTDSDNDGIPDAADAWPDDPENGAGANASDAGTDQATFDPNGDDDADGLPNGLEIQYPGTLDPHNPYDATNDRGDGISYLDAYQQGLPLFQPLEPSTEEQPTAPAANDSTSSPELDPYADDDGDGIPNGVELQFPGILDPLVQDSGNDRGDGLTYLQAYQAGLVLDVLDNDNDGMTDAYELNWALDPFNPADAMQIMNDDGIFIVEKARLGLYPWAALSSDQLEALRPSAALVDDPNLSLAENDWDGDGISNRDEVLLFDTDPRDASSTPSANQLLDAYGNSLLSATTLINLQEGLSGNNAGEENGQSDFSGNGAGRDNNSPDPPLQERYIESITLVTSYHWRFVTSGPSNGQGGATDSYNWHQSMIGPSQEIEEINGTKYYIWTTWSQELWERCEVTNEITIWSDGEVTQEHVSTIPLSQEWQVHVEVYYQKIDAGADGFYGTPDDSVAPQPAGDQSSGTVFPPPSEPNQNI